MKQVLLFGPLVPPFNGQAVAFTIVADSFKKEEKILINTARFEHKVSNTVYTIYRTIVVFLFCRFDVIYFTSSRSALGFLKDFPMLLLGRLCRKRIINHLHGADFKKFLNSSRLLRPVVKFAYSGVDTSVILIEQMKDEFSDFPDMKLKTIGNCFSAELNQATEIRKEKIQLLYLSNLMGSKGIVEFLDASFDLLDQYPALEIKVAGSFLGDRLLTQKQVTYKFNQRLADLQRRFGSRVEYLGTVQGAEKIKLLTESSIFVLPSYYETEAYPISIIEAMRTENAILSTHHNFLPFIVKPENGVVVETRSAPAICEGVHNLLRDEVRLKQIQQNNRLEAETRYSPERYIQQITSLISSN